MEGSLIFQQVCWLHHYLVSLNSAFYWSWFSVFLRQRWIFTVHAVVTAVHRGAFCQWIYYCHSSKSTWKETGKTHLCVQFFIGLHASNQSIFRDGGRSIDLKGTKVIDCHFCFMLYSFGKWNMEGGCPIPSSSVGSESQIHRVTQCNKTINISYQNQQGEKMQDSKGKPANPTDLQGLK